MPDSTPPDQQPPRGRLGALLRLDLTTRDDHAARVDAHGLASYAVGWQVHVTVGERTPWQCPSDLPSAFAGALLAGVHIVFDGNIEAVSAWYATTRQYADDLEADSSRRGRRLRAVDTR